MDILERILAAVFAAMFIGTCAYWIWRAHTDPLPHQRPKSKPPESLAVDQFIEAVLSETSSAAQWLDFNKDVITEVFANGEAWVSLDGRILAKGDPDAVAIVTFSAIKAAMLKYYAEAQIELANRNEDQ